MDTFRYKVEMLVWVGAETPVYDFSYWALGAWSPTVYRVNIILCSSCWCTFFKWFPWNLRRKHRKELHYLSYTVRGACYDWDCCEWIQCPQRVAFSLPLLCISIESCGWSLCWCGQGLMPRPSSIRQVHLWPARNTSPQFQGPPSWA